MFPLVHSQKKLQSKERGPINQEGSWGMLEIRGEISSRVLIEISGLKVEPSESQGAEKGLISFCVGWERWCLGLSASPRAASPPSLLKWPRGGFSSGIFHEGLLFSTAPAKAQLLENVHKQKGVTPLFLGVSSCSQKDLLLPLSRCSELSGGPRELSWLLLSEGQQWQLTLAPLHLCPQWTWADYADKGQRECLTWSQPSSYWLRK